MPEYSLYCGDCELGFTKTWSFDEYDKKLKNIRITTLVNYLNPLRKMKTLS